MVAGSNPVTPTGENEGVKRFRLAPFYFVYDTFKCNSMHKKNSHRSGSIGFTLRPEGLIVIRCRKSYIANVNLFS